MEFKKVNKRKNGSSFPVWKSSVKIDENLTLYCEYSKYGSNSDYFVTNVYSDPKGESGAYYDCESLAENIAQAEKYILDFVNLVKENPQKYYGYG